MKINDKEKITISKKEKLKKLLLEIINEDITILRDCISDIFMINYEYELTDEELTYLNSIKLKIVEDKE